MNFKKITFKNKEGEDLAAYIDLPPNGKPKAFAVFAHCFTCNKNLKAVSNVSRALTVEGIGVMRFDFTGLGESEGDFSDTNFSSNVDDLIAAAGYLEEHYEAPSLLIGHSLGGAAVLIAARSIPSVNLAGRPFKIKQQFIEDLDANNMERHVGNFKKPLLVLHSPSDNIVGIDNAARIYQAALHPKSFVALPDADHLLTMNIDSQYVGKTIATWSRTYLYLEEAGSESILKTEKQVVARIGEEKFTTEIQSGNHALIADEPEAYGGNDYGPNPYDYLATSLASCTAMTIKMYTNQKKWPLEEVYVHVQHKKEHAQDCEDNESKTNKIDVLEREIELIGDLDDKQRQRALDIADKCPVHKTLSADIKINSSLVGG
ncbi:MAG: osmotically inducible protein C [Bacteroidetes bacterium SW_10_40_5]|nr:MAG: osmotically inducible protein C [Bacteroidetes bacterium SW_10_40_5]